MSVVPIACNDLMFFLHHCFIDKIFDAHIRRWGITPASYPNVQVYGHRAYDCMCPFLECWYHRTMFTQSTTFGYRYDIYKNF
ncbi:hypothetical protein GDO81_021240 [Engystomops pustulosus]|uniref:Tyrosinase n=1 Tax=Engystomops pustulosus TaxID=76066 RepID=A0AAV6ZAK6_ENGPU|nr:hypothetical protein GDO81_021240 [Engystomops pustulosus]